MTPSEINQLAAARMLAATLHNTVKSAREFITTTIEDPETAEAKALLAELDAALEHNEPEVLKVIADAYREARVRSVLLAAVETYDAEQALARAEVALDPNVAFKVASPERQTLHDATVKLHDAVVALK